MHTMHPGLPIAAPARARPSTSRLRTNSVPSSHSRPAAGSPGQLQQTEDIDSRISTDVPRVSTTSRRTLVHHPRPGDLDVGSNHTNKSATIPWDVLHHFLCVEVGEWFWDQGMDPENVLDKYNTDGTLKENEDFTKPTLWQKWVSKRKRSATEWQNRWKKSQLLRKFEYDGVRIDELLVFLIKTQREQYRSNPYNLSSNYYILIFLSLAAWAIGSIVCGHHEARAKIEVGATGVLATLCRGLIGAIPAVTQITLFLFPPLVAGD
ncbi:uncharacterized protein K460DRAFT_395392 [Cucurbitaria berberidis CBS 394.84]|uniref:Uncharacterized protein n=1 Tax=Cucurbitaria berberidis CBS 394.84 TaxID=1168544 RepID=A0A9P4GI08_9PLEO|nr:uncharacterized protein K460DRAFT_395392 [Cucurbitaria berberidis CBS 394.84]KAF1845834.1 hypothetical protein K460DRAFT_395392 [Cucurbitaria berberidis CBS 394.84]